MHGATVRVNLSGLNKTISFFGPSPHGSSPIGGRLRSTANSQAISRGQVRSCGWFATLEWPGVASAGAQSRSRLRLKRLRWSQQSNGTFWEHRSGPPRAPACTRRSPNSVAVASRLLRRGRDLASAFDLQIERKSWHLGELRENRLDLTSRLNDLRVSPFPRCANDTRRVLAAMSIAQKGDENPQLASLMSKAKFSLRQAHRHRTN
jgi:hypothetical protein